MSIENMNNKDHGMVFIIHIFMGSMFLSEKACDWLTHIVAFLNPTLRSII